MQKSTSYSASDPPVGSVADAEQQAINELFETAATRWNKTRRWKPISGAGVRRSATCAARSIF